MREYHKINSIYKRDERGKFISGEYSQPEFEYLADLHWLFTEKVDGTNVRIHWDGSDIVTIAGRTDRAQMPVSLLMALNGLVTRDKLAGLFTFIEVILHGEGYGAGIQSGGNYRFDQSFVLFDVQVGDLFLRRPDVEEIAGELGVDVVPQILIGTLAQGEKLVQEGFGSAWGTFRAEGLVGMPIVPLQDRRGRRIVVKMKTKDYA